MIKIDGKIHLFSPGGCGTRIFYDWVKKYYAQINDQSNVHNGTPPKNLNVNDRVIYLFGSPEDSVLSFYKKHVDDRNFMVNHCKNLKVPFINLTLYEYIKNGVDLFRLNDHYNRYSNCKNLLLVNYNHLWENLDEICEYLNLMDVKHTFPEKKKRRDIKLNHNHRDLKKIYNTLNEKIEKIKILKK